MSTDRLVAFLTARLDEDEQIARAATGDPWVLGRDRGYRFAQAGDVYAIATDGTPALVAHGHGCGPDVSQEQTSDHIARHDPARVLADVRAKRTIVALLSEAAPHSVITGQTDRQDFRDGWLFAAYDAARTLASVYSAHPDFDQAWAIDVSTATDRAHQA